MRAPDSRRERHQASLASVKVAHLLRKYRPEEWGGTESAVHRLLDGLGRAGIESVVFAPRAGNVFRDPIAESGHVVKRYRAFLPVLGISREKREQAIAVGGNLMSLDLIGQLMREPGLSAVHTHALNRIGGIGLRVARMRRLPLVVTVHGGVFDLPARVRATLEEPTKGGLEWGKIFGMVLRSRRLLEEADAVITCNRREAELMRERYPKQRVIVQPHGVPLGIYNVDQRAEAWEAFPELRGRRLVLAVGRIDPVKNQAWLVEHMAELLRGDSGLALVLAGACTDEAYGKLLKKTIRRLNLDDRVVLTDGLPPGDDRLIGLLQAAEVVVVPSQSETFGLVILEAWAAGTAVISSKTSGALALVDPRCNGWLFDLENPKEFQKALSEALANREQSREFAEAGRALVRREYDTDVLAGRMKALYEELAEKKLEVRS